jgi:23S rRNA (pseudouridine1915-N3)-methyltransferase
LKILIIFVGKTNEKYLETGIEEYLKRLSRYVSVATISVKASASKETNKAMIEEGKNISGKLLPGDFVVTLDEQGNELSSIKFSVELNKWMSGGKSRLVFISGGAYGIDPVIKSKSNYVLSLSKMTFTHQMIRLLFTEQLYRAMTILKNEKYHHGP